MIPLKTEASNRKQFHFLEDGSVCLSTYGFTTFEYMKANLDKFDGDENRVLKFVLDKANFDEFNTFVQDLYKKDQAYFIENAPQIAEPYKDPTQVYDRNKKTSFKMEYQKINPDIDIIPDAEMWVGEEVVIKADRFEVAVALWEHTSNMNFDLSSKGYHLERVTEFDKDNNVLNVWQDRTNNYQDHELVLVSMTQK